MKKVFIFLILMVLLSIPHAGTRAKYIIPQQTLTIKTQDHKDAKIVGSAPIISTSDGMAYAIKGGSYIQLGTLDSSLKVAQGFTIKFKMKWNDFATYSRVFDFYDSSAGRQDNFLLTHSGSGSGMLIGARKGTATTDIALKMNFRSTVDEIVITADSACNIRTENKTAGTVSTVKNGICPFINNVTRNINYIGKSAWGGDKALNGDIYYLEIRSSDNRLLVKMDGSIPQ